MTIEATRLSLAGGPPSNGTMRGLASALLRCGSIAELRSLAPLPDEAQRLIDQAVVKVGLERLTIAADVMAKGLTMNIADPLSVMEVYWERISKAGHAQRTMLPGARGERQMQDRTAVRVPIYATTDDFSFNIRTLRAAERAGAPLDTSMVEESTRRVNEAIEDAIINGAGIQVGGNSAPGILNAPNVNTYAYTGGEAWDVVGHTGEEILTDVLAMVDKLQAVRMWGPYKLYVPTTYMNKLNADFKSATSGTILERLQALEVGGGKLQIGVADMLPANRTALIQMTSDVIDVVVGQTPTVVSWEDGPGWERFFVVLAFIVPRVKDNYENKSGICLGYTS